MRAAARPKLAELEGSTVVMRLVLDDGETGRLLAGEVVRVEEVKDDRFLLVKLRGKR